MGNRIFTASMKNPWTVDGKRVGISSPYFEWEIHGKLNDQFKPPNVYVNECPQI